MNQHMKKRTVGQVAVGQPGGVIANLPTEIPTSLGEIASLYAALRAAAAEHGFSEAAERLRHRQLDAASPALVMVVGRGKAGKSSLINSMLGRDLADVGRVPKSWTIDIFSKSSSETGTLRFRDGTERTYPVVAAREEKERHKPAEDNANQDGTFERTNLTDVVWNVDVAWPPPGLSLVDTAGLLQDRGDVARERISLYGAEGLELRLNDPFLYFFGRADVVLWCVHATKVDERDSLEMLASALERLGGHRPHVLGIVTQWDRVTEEDRPRILARCRELYGGMVTEWVPCSTKVEASSPFSPAALRRRVEQIALGSGSEERLNRYQEMYRNDLADLVTDLESVAEFLRRNCVVHQKLRSVVESSVRAVATRVSGEVTAACTDASARGCGAVETIWSSSGNDRTRFGSRVQGILSQDSQLQSALSSAFRGAQDRMQSSISSAMAEAEWTAAAIGERGSAQLSRFKIDAVSGLARRGSIATVSSLNIGSGLTGGAAMQRSSAELLESSIVFLPFAMVGGLVGSLLAAAQASEAKGAARDAIRAATEATAKDAAMQIWSASEAYLRSAAEQADAALARVTGGAVASNAERVLKISATLTKLLVPASRSQLLVVGPVSGMLLSGATPVVMFAESVSNPSVAAFTAAGFGARLLPGVTAEIKSANESRWKAFCAAPAQLNHVSGVLHAWTKEVAFCEATAAAIRARLVEVHGRDFGLAKAESAKQGSQVLLALERIAMLLAGPASLNTLQAGVEEEASRQFRSLVTNDVASIEAPSQTPSDYLGKRRLSAFGSLEVRSDSPLHAVVRDATKAASVAADKRVRERTALFARGWRNIFLPSTIIMWIVIGANGYPAVGFIAFVCAVALCALAMRSMRKNATYQASEEATRVFGSELVQGRSGLVATPGDVSTTLHSLEKRLLLRSTGTKNEAAVLAKTGADQAPPELSGRSGWGRLEISAAAALIAIPIGFFLFERAEAEMDQTEAVFRQAVEDPDSSNIRAAISADADMRASVWAPYYALSRLWRERPDLTATPFVHYCGDGVVDSPDELCDDGNELETDDCGADCAPPNILCFEGETRLPAPSGLPVPVHALLRGGKTCIIDPAGRVACWRSDTSDSLRVSDRTIASPHRATIASWGGSVCTYGQGTSVCFDGDLDAVSSYGHRDRYGEWVSLSGIRWAFSPDDGLCYLDADDVLCWFRDDRKVQLTQANVRSVAYDGNRFCWVGSQGLLNCEAGSKHAPPTGKRFASIVGSKNAFCAMGEDGTIACWGDIADSERADIPAAGRPSTLAAGGGRFCVERKEASSTVCWGSSLPLQEYPNITPIAVDGSQLCGVRATLNWAQPSAE